MYGCGVPMPLVFYVKADRQSGVGCGKVEKGEGKKEEKDREK